jgi:WD40 repeat protein
MAGVDTAVRSWAAAHAGTVTREAIQASQDSATAAGPLSLARQWIASSEAVWSLACTTRADGQVLVATGGDDGQVMVWDALSGALLHTVATGHTDPLSSLAWLAAADGRLLLAAGSLSGVRIWDQGSGDFVPGPAGPAGHVQSVAWATAPDGQVLLATGGRDGSVRIWDGSTGAPLRALPGHTRAVRSVAWATALDGRPLLATASRGDGARIWDGSTGQQLHSLTERGVNALAWGTAPDGRPLLATGGNDGDVVVWDGLTGTQLYPVRCAAGWIVSLAWGADAAGRLVLAAAGDRGKDVRLWDGRTSTSLCTLADRGQVSRVALAAAKGGRLALVTGGHDGAVQVWWVDTALPAPSARSGQTAATPGEAGVQIEEIIPPGLPEAWESRATTVAWAVPAEGPPLLATGNVTGDVQVWDGRSGTLRNTFSTSSGMVRSVAWAVLADGKLFLAAGGGDGNVRVWDGRSGAVLYTVSTSSGMVRSVAWAVLPDGRVLLAAADGEGVQVWNGLDGEPVHSLGFADVTTMAWAVLADGRAALAAGGAQGVWVWDGLSGTKLCECGTRAVNSVAWAVPGDGSALLATAGHDGGLRVWDGTDGTLLQSQAEPTGPAYSVAWGVLADGRLILASTGRFDQRTTRIWDGRTLSQLASLPGAQGAYGCIAWALLPGGEALLAVTPGTSHRLARIWALRSTQDIGSPLAAGSTTHGLHPAEAGLLALGRAGLWPPLGLIADLVALTGSGQAELNDGRLQALAPHPGIRRLRALGWPVLARLSFAGLLTSDVAVDASFVPPDRAAPRALRDALTAALANGIPRQPAAIGLAELRRAADAITDRAISLLTILGPAAAAADPTLPVRLAQHIPNMPALDGKQFRLLREANRPTAVRRRERDGGLWHAPGTAGIELRGSLTHLLPTQLALPADVLVARYLQDQLLYRRHTTRIPPVPDPVTIILDTTPPTYGPAENILRLAAHLITTVLWEHGEHPVLISLTRPSVPTTLTSRAQLAQLWTTRTLDPPGPAIAAALGTADSVGAKIVLLSHHFASMFHYMPAPDRRLLTTHHPAEPTPPPPSHPNHFHLPAHPGQDQLIRVVWALLTPAGNGS